MDVFDELWGNCRAALAASTKIRQEYKLDEKQRNLREVLVRDLLNAMVHAHNLVINLERGTDVFSPILPKPFVPKPSMDSSTRHLATKLQARLKQMERELEGLDEKGQAELFPKQK